MKAIKFTLIALLVAALIPIVSCGPSKEEYEKSEEGKAWNYIRSIIQDPNDATLIEYYSTDEDLCKKMLEEVNNYARLQKGTSGKYTDMSIGIAKVEGRNGYGQMITSNFIVYFKNGEPLHAGELHTRKDVAELPLYLHLKGFKFE